MDALADALFSEVGSLEASTLESRVMRPTICGDYRRSCHVRRWHSVAVLMSSHFPISSSLQ